MTQSLSIKPGDKIGIISSARAIHFSEIAFADSYFREWGLIPVYGNTIGKQYQQFAGEDDLRADDLQKMLDDKTIRAIIFARGGYGTIRIIDKIDFTRFMENPKWLCGYSDITILHTHVNDKLGLPTLHATMPYSFPRNTESAITSLRDILMGELPVYEIKNDSLNIQGEAEGELIGGNLSILYSLLGTKYGFNTNNKILFIEDIDEYLYHIDRMMMSLKLAGKLQGLKGMIVGDFTDMKDNKVAFGNSAEEIIYEHVQGLSIPVCFHFPCGHIDDNKPLILGKKIRLSVGDKTKLQYID
ncbi:MAG: LD-carboxypeptidase [Chitinophagales bacterium]|nr:LD-carboxypeptidase [Chitinophagales bacterium]